MSRPESAGAKIRAAEAGAGWDGAFDIARTVKSFIRFGAAGLHIEDRVVRCWTGNRSAGR